MPVTCSECSRLWREMDEVIQRKFRLEAELHHAEEREHRQLAIELREQLVSLAREQAIVNQSMFEHESGEHRPKVMLAR
jgi:hypothetical protein